MYELPPNDILKKILADGVVTHPTGKQYKLTSATSAAEVAAMYAFLRKSKPTVVIEIGMAYGVSALTILTSLGENGDGRLISIDPYPKWESARETALNNIELSGFRRLHEHVHAVSELALPRLVTEGVKADFVYIDGHHGFDHAFVDFFYSDLLLSPGGVVAFDDSAWRSVHKVIRYLQTHRDYEELDVGLSKGYRGSNPLGTLARLVQGRFGSARYFKKRSDFFPPYNFYRSF